MNRRVVVTGTGVVSPVGNNTETFWKNLLEGVCGIDFITAFPTDDLPVKIAGEVKDFSPADYEIEPPFARKQDKFTVYAVAVMLALVYLPVLHYLVSEIQMVLGHYCSVKEKIRTALRTIC